MVERELRAHADSQGEGAAGLALLVHVHVPDRPGVLAGITQALGAEKINIEDFELHHLSPERGGTLDVLIAGEDGARRAAELLEGQGYSVVASRAVEDA